MTTLEPEMQSAVESLVWNTVNDAMSRGGRISNGAALFIRPATMTVAAYVGSAGYFRDGYQGQIDGVQIQRQPGSTLKPFLYCLALDNGFTATTVLPDIPTDFGGDEIYTPSNYNQQFNGPVRLRQALASSLNVPAVYTLNRLGVLNFVNFLLSAGFRSLESQKDFLGLGLSLGNVEISLWELVQGYGLFLNGGKPVTLSFRPEDQQRQDKVLALADPRIFLVIRDILIRQPDRTLGFGRGGSTRLPFEGAIKTGTSNQFNNIWAVGFTPDLLGGVWMGNFDGSTVLTSPGAGLPAGILSRILEDFSSGEPFSPLEGLEIREICSLSGLASTGHCPHTINEWFLPGTEPLPCHWHQSGSIDPVYPQEYAAWMDRYGYRHPDNYQYHQLEILRPQSGAVFFYDPTVPAENQAVLIEAVGQGLCTVSVNGEILYQGSFPAKCWWHLERGHHDLTVSDDVSVREIPFEVR